MPVRIPTRQAFAEGPARGFGGLLFGSGKDEYVVWIGDVNYIQ